MKRSHIFINLFLLFLPVACIFSQQGLLLADRKFKLNLNESGSEYIQITGLNQVWYRYTELNPNSTVNGYPKEHFTDLSIRRLRFQILAQLTDRVFMYTQFGQNNLNFQTTKYTGAFFHDATVEYAIDKKRLAIGGGITGWNGLSRYASPSIGSILSLDAPLYLQATNGVNDQFLRKLSVFAKGQVGKLDYRVALTTPMTITGASATVTTPTSTDFSFTNRPAKMQAQAYLKYMFADVESNLIPYQAGSYLGRKSVFNVGGGVIYQPDAMWALDGTGNTVMHDMTLMAADIFYDKPLSETTALTFFGVVSHYDFGKNYYRNVGVDGMSPTTPSPAAPGGQGNNMPLIGTGTTFYGQVGYLFGKDFLSKHGKLQPFACVQVSDWQVLRDNMTMGELGINYLTHGTHDSKLSLEVQNRPTYKTVGMDIKSDTRKNMVVMQYQVSF